MKQKQFRPSWDEYFLSIADVIRQRSTCLRRQVGCVIVGKNKAILTAGYNGAPKGCKHCEEIGCIRQQMNIPSGERHELCRASHAEMNAIAQAAANGISLEGATLYCTNAPCSICAKLIINAGIQKVVYSDSYDDLLAKQLLQEAGIKYKYISPYEKEDTEIIDRGNKIDDTKHDCSDCIHYLKSSGGCTLFDAKPAEVCMSKDKCFGWKLYKQDEPF